MHEDPAESREAPKDTGMPYTRNSVLYGLLPPTRANVRHDEHNGNGGKANAGRVEFGAGTLEAVEQRRRERAQLLAAQSTGQNTAKRYAASKSLGSGL